MISIIVPTLNEETRIGATLRALQELPGEKEILIADGGSDDRTTAIAAELGIRVMACQRGRGCQIRTAAAEAKGDVLWFVHGDSRPETGGLGGIGPGVRR